MLTFPHPTLTPIPTKPTHTTLQLLQRELYANARAIYSTRGGGAHGHLAVIMPPADYLARVGQAFDIPIHPGIAPVHAPNATSAQITETNRQYGAALADHALYQTTGAELKKQIIAAVPNLYLAILSDNEMGYADVSCATMLHHLKTTYGIITTDDLETNRARLSADWLPENPIEDLWIRLRDVQRFAEAGAEPISDTTCLRLTLATLEATGVLTTSIERWRENDESTWTLIAFQSHFTKADKERHRKLTAQAAGYHGTHATTMTTPLPSTHNASNPFSVRVDNCTMYYCWSHGLGTNPTHTSLTCRFKKPNHEDAATVRNRIGGSNIIMDNRLSSRNSRGPPTNPNPPTPASSTSS